MWGFTFPSAARALSMREDVSLGAEAQDTLAAMRRAVHAPDRPWEQG
jgi:hypothetical protein